MGNQTAESKKTLYERLGGADAIKAVVDVFYDRILADDSVNYFFKHTDMEKQRRHQTLFISFAMGGPNHYTGGSMEKVHTGMNIQPKHFDAIVNHLVAALKQFHVSDGEIQEVAAKLLPMKESIVGK